MKYIYEKVEVIKKGTFNGWLRDSKGNAHNPKFADLYILTKKD